MAARHDDAIASALFHSRSFTIEPEWIDYNDHLNMARYPIMFDRAVDDLIVAIGLSVEAGDGITLFAAETQLRYLHAVLLNDRPEVETIVLRHDAKRVHSFQRMRIAGDVVATAENLHLCVSREVGTASVHPFPEYASQRLTELATPRAEWPSEVGQPIAARMATP